MKAELTRLFAVAGARVGTLRVVAWNEGGVEVEEDRIHAPECWTLESDSDAIPAGLYEVRFRRFGPKFEKYRARYSWNEPGMLELLDVPGRTDILIHPGNTKADTLGCVLVGHGAFCYGELAESVEAYRQIYGRLSEELLRPGGRVWLEVKESSDG